MHVHALILSLLFLLAAVLKNPGNLVVKSFPSSFVELFHCAMLHIVATIGQSAHVLVDGMEFIKAHAMMDRLIQCTGQSTNQTNVKNTTCAGNEKHNQAPKSTPNHKIVYQQPHAAIVFGRNADNVLGLVTKLQVQPHVSKGTFGPTKGGAQIKTPIGGESWNNITITVSLYAA